MTTSVRPTSLLPGSGQNTNLVIASTNKSNPLQNNSQFEMQVQNNFEMSNVDFLNLNSFELSNGLDMLFSSRLSDITNFQLNHVQPSDSIYTFELVMAFQLTSLQSNFNLCVQLWYNFNTNSFYYASFNSSLFNPGGGGTIFYAVQSETGIDQTTLLADLMTLLNAHAFLTTGNGSTGNLGGNIIYTFSLSQNNNNFWVNTVGTWCDYNNPIIIQVDQNSSQLSLTQSILQSFSLDSICPQYVTYGTTYRQLFETFLSTFGMTVPVFLPNLCPYWGLDVPGIPFPMLSGTTSYLTLYMKDILGIPDTCIYPAYVQSNIGNIVNLTGYYQNCSYFTSAQNPASSFTNNTRTIQSTLFTLTFQQSNQFSYGSALMILLEISQSGQAGSDLLSQLPVYITPNTDEMFQATSYQNPNYPNQLAYANTHQSSLQVESQYFDLAPAIKVNPIKGATAFSVSLRSAIYDEPIYITSNNNMITKWLMISGGK
jgi:hypothetical protein